MKATAITTIQDLQTELKNYANELPIVMLDNEQGYVSVAFKKETAQKEGKTCQWLVINDRFTYEATFLDLQNSQQKQALDKMLVEMNKEHAQAIEPIHNWCCQQNEEALFIGILKDDRTLDGALSYCLGKAKEQAENANSVMVDDETVFAWVRDYFLLDKVEAPKVSGTVTSKQSTQRFCCKVFLLSIF